MKNRLVKDVPLRKGARLIDYATVTKTEKWWYYITLQERDVKGEERLEIAYNAAIKEGLGWKLKKSFPTLLYNHKERWYMLKEITESFLERIQNMREN